MEITFVISEKEIMDNPNDFELGEYVRKKFWDIRNTIDKGNSNNLYVINYMTEAIKTVELVDISETYVTKNGFDKCILCGKESPYKFSTHIDKRLGYVSGVGQTCFSPSECEK